MEENKRKKSIELSVGMATCIVIIIILLVALIIIGMYTWFQKKSDENFAMANKQNVIGQERENAISDKEQEQSNHSDEKLVTLDIHNELVQKLYQSILKSDESTYTIGNKASFYKDTKTTYDTLNNAEKVMAVYQNLKQTNAKKITIAEAKTILKDSEKFNELYEIINEGITVYPNVQKIANQIFGTSDNIDWESYEGQGIALEYANDNYYEIGYQGGGGRIT